MSADSSDSGPSRPSDSIGCACPNGHMLQAPAKLAGKKGKCPKCGATFTIPEHTPSVSMPREQVDTLRKEKDSLVRSRFLSDWWSFALILLGVILLPIGRRGSGIGSLILLFIFFTVGIGLGAKYKGQSVLWGLLTLLCFLPGIVVAFLPDVARKRLHEITNTLDKHLAQGELRNERDRLLAQRKSNQLFSFLTGLPGLMLSIGGFISAFPPDLNNPPPPIVYLPLLVGGILFFVGVALAANYKGRSACWGLMAIPCFFGLFILAIASDFNKERLEQLDKLIRD